MQGTLFNPLPTNHDEEWREIDGFPDHFVSSHGRVASLSRVVARDGQRGNLTVRGRMRATAPQTAGYPQVILSRDGETHGKLVHRLVMLHHGPESPDYSERCSGVDAYVNHIDGDRTNNHIDNLEWVTSQENALHGVLTKMVKYTSVEQVAERICQWAPEVAAAIRRESG